MTISADDYAVMSVTAQRLGVAPDSLYRLIQFESKWNPQAKNPKSSARGLIQFTDSTAQALGYTGSLDLVTKNPSISDQLKIVEQYLQAYAPFTTKQSLYMAVFYPAARSWNASKRFPQSVIDKNPGIYTPAHYIAKVEGKDVAGKGVAAIILIGIALGMYYLTRKA